MLKSIRGTAKKICRPKTTGAGAQIGMRWQVEMLAAIDAWRRKQEGNPSRSEAIRQLVARALASEIPSSPPSKQAARKAAEMAAHTIDRLDKRSGAPPERQRRKRHLVRGPKEFRDIRADQPKTKS
jgi:hypothetical protein